MVCPHFGTSGIIPGLEHLGMNFLSKAKWLKSLKNILSGLQEKRTNLRIRDFWGKNKPLGRNRGLHLHKLAARRRESGRGRGELEV